MRVGISLPVRELQNDTGAIKAFAQAAEELGLTHLRVPDQVIRPDSGPLHEPLTVMALIAGVTERIDLSLLRGARDNVSVVLLRLES